MALSPLLLAILEQAKEPLHCLHGAGYFTPKEWVQLDLIMNKEYSWTIGPLDTCVQNSVDQAIRLEHEVSSFYVGGRKDVSDLDAISSCASIEPTISDIHMSPKSVRTPCQCPVGTIPVKLFENLRPYQSDPRPLSYNREQRQSAGHLSTQGDDYNGLNMSIKEKVSGYPTSITGSSSKSPLLSSAQKMKSISTWTTEVQKNSLRQTSSNNPSALALWTSSQSKEKPSRSPQSTINGNRSKERQSDVNIFETSNTAEWDDASQTIENNSPSNRDLSTLIDEKYGKIADLITQQSHNKEIRYRASSSSSFSPRSTTRSSNRVLDIPRLTRHKEFKDRKNLNDNETAAQQKTKVCWYWAESPGGCRYRPDECLNLHVKPIPNAMLRQSLTNGRSGRTTASSPSGKSLTCWSWASTGSCIKGDKCKGVHDWVVGGVVHDSKQDSNSWETLDRDRF